MGIKLILIKINLLGYPLKPNKIRATKALAHLKFTSLIELIMGIIIKS